MKEVLFRGISIDSGEWVEGDLIQLDHEICIAGRDMWATEFSKGTIELKCEEIFPETKGQFVGKTDKNGKKIFEGDKRQNGDWIEYSEAWAKFGWTDGGYLEDISSSDEVVGNIYYKDGTD